MLTHTSYIQVDYCRSPVHDDVIKWKHFPRNWPFVRGIHRSPVNSPHKGQWRGALMFSLICVWINDWVNNCEAGDLRRYRAHYDVIVIAITWDYYTISVPLLSTIWLGQYISYVWPFPLPLSYHSVYLKCALSLGVKQHLQIYPTHQETTCGPFY